MLKAAVPTEVAGGHISNLANVKIYNSHKERMDDARQKVGMYCSIPDVNKLLQNIYINMGEVDEKTIFEKIDNLRYDDVKAAGSTQQCHINATLAS